MELSAILETLSLAPLSADRGGAESPGLWSLRPPDASRRAGRSRSPGEARSCSRVPPPPGFAPLPGPERPPWPPAPPAPASRYKTELCRTFSESGRCRYGAKCQFAHGPGELRPASRHPKYKTEPCRKFYLQGRCPYGARCHFIHGPDEGLAAAPPLRQSVSFSGRASPPPPSGAGPLSPSAFAPGTPVAPRDPAAACCPACRRAGLWGPSGSLARSPSAHSLGSDPDDSGSSLGGSDSPVFEAGVFGPPPAPAPPRRLPIFHRISVSE